ncbi:MAG TPA: hypothetical protein V6D17_20085, partial [Candidatus Obscuribacterales bacterium]
MESMESSLMHAVPHRDSPHSPAAYVVGSIRCATREVNRWPPYTIIALGMVLALLLFLALDLVEGALFPQAAEMPLRFVHLARGFLATSGG